MIIHFFLLAILCAAPKTQTAAPKTQTNDLLTYGQTPRFPTIYIEEIEYQRFRIRRTEYATLQKNSLFCINCRIKKIDDGYKHACPPYPNESSRMTAFNSQCKNLTKMQKECMKNYSSDTFDYIYFSNKNLLYHMQWVHEIHTNDIDSIKLELYDNTTIILSEYLAKHVIEHLKNNSLLKQLEPIET
jgi:hypothetical protein